MGTATILLTSAIALTALADVAFALLPWFASGKGLAGQRPKFLARNGRIKLTLALQRAACLACLLSLAIALVLAHGDLSGKRPRRGDTAPIAEAPAFLGLLLAFNLAINCVMLVLTFRRRGALSSPVNKNSSFRDEETAVPIAPLKRHMGDVGAKSILSVCSTASAQGFAAKKAMVQTVDQYMETLCISVDASRGDKGHTGGLKTAERVLDRRDSDTMMRMLPLKTHRGGSQLHGIPEPLSPTGADEELLDALMHDTVKVLVEC